MMVTRIGGTSKSNIIKTLYSNIEEVYDRSVDSGELVFQHVCFGFQNLNSLSCGACKMALNSNRCILRSLKGYELLNKAYRDKNLFGGLAALQLMEEELCEKLRDMGEIY